MASHAVHYIYGQRIFAQELDKQPRAQRGCTPIASRPCNAPRWRTCRRRNGTWQRSELCCDRRWTLKNLLSVPTALNLADILTKPLPAAQLRLLRDMILGLGALTEPVECVQFVELRGGG